MEHRHCPGRLAICRSVQQYKEVISSKLKQLFLLAIVLSIAHGIEELATGFYNTDRSFLLTVGKVGGNLAVAFVIYWLILWGLFWLAYMLVVRGKWIRILSGIVGVVMLLELQHLYEVVATGKYYPGAYTAILFPIIGFFFWKELIKNWSKYG